MANDMVIRQGKADDIKALLTLIRELALFERAEKEVLLTEEILLQDGFGPSPRFHFFVAEVHNDVVGIALSYDKYSTWKGRCIYLEDIIVREDRRGKGIGSKLFEAVIDKARQEKVKRLEWQVLDWNEHAINFYKKYGAEISSEWLNGRIHFL